MADESDHDPDITVREGKYTFRRPPDDWRVQVLRYGEPWLWIEKGVNAVHALLDLVDTLGHELGKPQAPKTVNVTDVVAPGRRYTDEMRSARERAVALLMREVICEQVYRKFQLDSVGYDSDLHAHPNRVLDIRAIKPHEVVQHVVGTNPNLLAMTPDALRQEAARVLDLLDLTHGSAREPYQPAKAVSPGPKPVYIGTPHDPEADNDPPF